AVGACGRYGLSSVNLDRGWVGPDMIGIDAGAAVLALDNLLMAGRVRAVFHQVGCVRAGCERLGFVLRAPARPAWRAASWRRFLPPPALVSKQKSTRGGRYRVAHDPQPREQSGRGGVQPASPQPHRAGCRPTPTS